MNFSCLDMLFSVVFCTLVWLPFLYALPKGAPKCAINVDVIARGHKIGQNSGMGYQLKVSSTKLTPNQPITIEVINTKFAKLQSFTGLLMYLEGKDAKKRFGTFTKFNEDNFKPQTDICTRDGFTGDSKSVVTHKNKEDKFFRNNKFEWMPLPGDEAAQELTLRAVIVQRAPKFWAELQPVKLVFGSGSAPDAPAADAEN